ncbi:phragmoplast orienting kinesin 2 [Dorcoceras hygrometricum]|nr:phragmoplast orienting kinesin 2 [Dorcoceras hygrometricum]
MLREFKSLRRNLGKNLDEEEIENVPVNPMGSLNPQNGADPSRPPLNSIQEHFQSQTIKGDLDPFLSNNKISKFDRTPTKLKPNPLMNLRTPEKLGQVSKSRFGWAQKGDFHMSSSGVDSKEEGKVATNTNTPRSTRTVAKPNPSYSECNSTQSTPTKSVSKPPNPGFGVASGSRPQPYGSARVVNFGALSKGTPSSYNSSSVVNTVVVPNYDLKEDPSFWMEHNVQVLIRVRPLNNMEKSNYGFERCLKQESAQCISWVGQPENRFTFDHVACEAVDQETLFRVVGLPMVENCLSGYNSCMFAYGQTGSGKTYTMLGDTEELEVKPSSNRGMTPRVFEFLFARIRAEEEIRKDERLKYNCKCSFLEIYNEQITDLLDPLSTNLMLREDIKKGVYVENLSEFEVRTVGDILQLLCQGSSNRKVAATNMNRESSRSHSVFTCVIESRWETNSTTNFRFARLNLVDLAGSERQKSSGAEGKRLKEAASINKSLSTLGHVIMVLVDVAHGKPRHVPYRDSRLTFLLQDSLGGNSKTMIIANVSPSICCAAETLNTLKFAQRAKLIQNNAIVNEDSSGDVSVLQYQIQMLKEELAALKREKIARSLSFGPNSDRDTGKEDTDRCDHWTLKQENQSDILGNESSDRLKVSSIQVKSLEFTLAGALRREQMAETSYKQLEAEIEQLNRLVRQREEDTMCIKMMLKFREDKIQRLESLNGGLISADAYLLKENAALSEEIQLLRERIDKNPEVTRFAHENIKLLDQVRRFQDLYGEGERELLMDDISKLRNQIFLFIQENANLENNRDVNTSSESDALHMELERTLSELEESKRKLDCCLENNAKLRGEIEQLHASLNVAGSATQEQDLSAEVIKESVVEVPSFKYQSIKACQKDEEAKLMKIVGHGEDIMDLQLELDILKSILQEERAYRGEAEEMAKSLSAELLLSNEMIASINKEYKDALQEVEKAKLVIEALESQQILSINELEDLRISNNRYEQLLNEKDLEMSSLKDHTQGAPSGAFSSEGEHSLLEAKLKKMHDSLEKAKRLNQSFQSDLPFQSTSDEEMEEARKQVEVETAEVIVCLQDELSLLQQEVQDSNMKEMETRDRMMLLQTEMKVLEDNLDLKVKDNTTLTEMLEDRENGLRKFTEEWELQTCEIEYILAGGQDALKDASDQIDLISGSFPTQGSRIYEQFGRIKKFIIEKELVIKEIKQCLKDATDRRNEMECMLRSLRGAAVLMSETHQQECDEKDREILLLTSELNAKASKISELEDIIRHGKYQLRTTSVCATAAFVIVNRLRELNSSYQDSLYYNDLHLRKTQESISKTDAIIKNQASVIDEAQKQNEHLQKEIDASDENLVTLQLQFSEQEKRLKELEVRLDETEESKILEARVKLEELNSGVSTLKICMDEYVKQRENLQKDSSPRKSIDFSSLDMCQFQSGIGTGQHINEMNSCNIEAVRTETSTYSMNAPIVEEHIAGHSRLTSNNTLTSVKSRDNTIILLKKEIESAMKSLHEVETEMVKLRLEKEEFSLSEKTNRKSLVSLMNQAVLLQNAVHKFESEFELNVTCLNNKLVSLESILQGSRASWFQEKELLENELDDAKLVAAQKTIEASCVLEKFEEVQDTMKEADIMINELMIANEALKLDAQELKVMENCSANERDLLINEVQSLKKSSNLKDQHYEKLERMYEMDIVFMKQMFSELEDVILQVQISSMEEWKPVAFDFLTVKSQVFESTKLIKSLLEEVWSNIFVKDCAVSVLHLCHMGILLETANGLNVQNGFLHHGLCESNSIVSELREQNSRSRKDLEMCRLLKGKLLADVKKGFDRISHKVEESGDLTQKLSSFEKKIHDLLFQEELMLKRSNDMGSELAILTRELDLSNRQTFLSMLDQEKLLKHKDELLECQEETFMLELFAKEFESLISFSELKQMIILKLEKENTNRSILEILENFKRDVIFCSMDAALGELLLLGIKTEHALLQTEVAEASVKQNVLLLALDEKISTIEQMDALNKVLHQDVQSLKEVTNSIEDLKSSHDEAIESNRILSGKIHELESEIENLLDDIKMKETALETSSIHASELYREYQKLKADSCLLKTESNRLQLELETKDEKLSKLSFLEKENETLQSLLKEQEANNCALLQVLEDKRAEFESSLKSSIDLDIENCRLRDCNLLLKNSMFKLKEDLVLASEETKQRLISHHVIKDYLCSCIHDLKMKLDDINALKEENIFLRNELSFHDITEKAYLNSLSTKSLQIDEMTKYEDEMICKILNVFTQKYVEVDDMFNNIVKEVEKANTFMEQLELLKKLTTKLDSEFCSVQMEIARKDDILKGLLFDLSLLQESASNGKDHQSENEELKASLSELGNDFELKSRELEEAVVEVQMLKVRVQELTDTISALKQDSAKEHEIVMSLSCQNAELLDGIRDALEAKDLLEKDLTEARIKSESLETEIAEIEIALTQMSKATELLKRNLDTATSQRDDLDRKVLTLTKELERERAFAEESGAIASEAQELAESRKFVAEEKEEEVKLLERSIEELESTINVLEQKVDIVKGESERQLLQREELELELYVVKEQMQTVKANDSEIKRCLDEKEENLQEALQRIQVLEREIAERDSKISQCKAHISELNLHAEAQACEYQQKFKALEAMVGEVKIEATSTHGANPSSTKLDKNASKSRGSGSPFKCIGLGLVQQIKSERDEELCAERQRIEELEALASSRQKEIFLLKARLASTESMTHDVIRDLLGVKLNMNNCANLMDNQQRHSLENDAQNHNTEAQVKEQEVVDLKCQINEFIKERNGWLDEIERKQAELVAAHVSLEKLKERDRLLMTENEIFKMDSSNYKKRVMELEAELKKLCGQQNIQQRIHHHAKIKEENNLLKTQNEDLSMKLRSTEAILSRVKYELAQFRLANGKNPDINFDEEQMLDKKLKETEEERFHLAQKLLGLCTTVLKAAGITTATSEASLPMAEEAIEKLKNRVTSLEMELEDLKVKNRIVDERMRLSELRTQASPVNLRIGENSLAQNRAAQTPFLSAFER